MTLNPNHVLMNAVAHERQARLRAAGAAPQRPGAALPMRVRVGRMLIAVGTSLSGDRLERARPSHARQAA
jgi:hypothetical protein